MADFKLSAPNELLDKTKGTVFGMGYWKYRGIQITANYLNQATHVDVCTYMVKGVIDTRRRKNFTGFKLKNWEFEGTAKMFKVLECEYGSPYFEEYGRAPWMDVAIAQAKEAKGVKEWESPLYQMGLRYHAYAGVRTGINWDTPAHPGRYKGDPEGQAWCASFVSWCLGQVDEKTFKTGSSQLFINNSMFNQQTVPLYGAIAIWSNCTNEGTVTSGGHIAFVYGKVKDKENFYYCLGGNQSNQICIIPSDCTGEVFKNGNGWRKFSGFFWPKKQSTSDADNLGDADIYASSKEANNKLMSLELNTTENESTL